MQSKLSLRFFATSLIVLSTVSLRAQPVTSDSLARAVNRTQSELAQLSKLKFSGYIQAQFQQADTAGISSFAGGSFGDHVRNRFMIRRGRLKATYAAGPAMAVMQVDITEKGLGVKDAYISLTDPWVKWIGMQAGIFDRPFGYEIGYSSSKRESPERARVTQSLFPGERDIGASAFIAPPASSPLGFARLDVGFFNGSGPQAVDFDSGKDLIARLTMNKSVARDKVKLGAGFSYYGGGVVQSTPLLFDGVVEINDSTMGFVRDSNDSYVGQMASRMYTGLDAQVTVMSRIGETTLRGEYVQGVQPGTATSNVSPTKDPESATYIRRVNGAYLYVIHTIVKKHQLILKYDWYDPNTDIAGDAIGMNGSHTGKADITYTTTGIGYAFLPDKNIRITLYYDIVSNEISKNGGEFARDIPDNVVTVRLQYKFP
jgi:hypothetical protein